MDKLLAFIKGLGAVEKIGFATRCGTTLGYLRKAASTGQLLGESICINVERETGGLIRCETLRSDVDWAYLRNSGLKTVELAGQTAPQAIQAVTEVAQAAIKQVAHIAESEIKHVAGELLKDGEPWDGVSERRTAEQPWDGVTERRKLNAPLDRRVSPESVARAAFVRSQAETSTAGKGA